MAFSTTCIHKGCGQFMEPYLDPSNNKAFCSACDKELNNLTIFAKNQMKSAKQFKVGKKQLTFKCLNCNKDTTPSTLNDQVVCATCKQPLKNISDIFKNMLLARAKSKKDD